MDGNHNRRLELLDAWSLKRRWQFFLDHRNTLRRARTEAKSARSAEAILTRRQPSAEGPRGSYITQLDHNVNLYEHLVEQDFAELKELRRLLEEFDPQIAEKLPYEIDDETIADDAAKQIREARGAYNAAIRRLASKVPDRRPKKAKKKYAPGPLTTAEQLAVETVSITAGNYSKAAEKLGISRAGVTKNYKRGMAKLGKVILKTPKKKPQALPKDERGQEATGERRRANRDD